MGPLSSLSPQPPVQQPGGDGASLTNQLLQSMLGRLSTFPQDLQNYQAAENTALSDYQNALRTAGRNTQGPFGAMLTGMLTAPNPADMKGVFASGMQGMEANRLALLEEEKQREVAATNEALKLRRARTKEFTSPVGTGVGTGVMTQLAHASLNPIQNIGGVGVDRLTGKTVVPKEFVEKYLTIRSQIYTKLVESGIEGADVIADQMARNAIYSGLRDPSVAGSTYSQRPENVPLPSQGNVAPADASPLVNIAPPGSVDPGTGEIAKKTAGEWVSTLNRQIAEAVAVQDYATADKLSAALKALKASAPQPMSKPAMARAETTEKETAKDFVDYEKELTAKNDAGNTMLRNIGHLQREAANANFGAGSSFKTQALKWADTLGVSIPEDQRKAMDANQIIGKVALQLATIGAKNISSRPTQMEFQKLLEEGVPSTGMTKEAFLAVLNQFKETAQLEQSQLSEFMKFKHSLPKGAVSAGDFSDYWALRKDPRYYNLSIQDVLDTMQARGMSWNQVISKLRERK